MNDELTVQEQKELGVIVRIVLEYPDLADDLVENIGGQISDDPQVMAMQIIEAAVTDPFNFDATVKSYEAETKDFAFAGLGALALGAGKGIGKLFKNKKGSGKVKGFFKKIFKGGKIKGMLGRWKSNRQLKNALKNSGDPNWKEKYKEQKTRGGSGEDAALGAAGGEPGEDGEYIEGERNGGGIEEDMTVGEYMKATGTTAGRGHEEVILPTGITEDEIVAGIDQLVKNKKTIKIWRIIGIGAGVAFVGTLIWALTK